MATIKKITHFLNNHTIPVRAVPLLTWVKNTDEGCKDVFYNMSTVKLGASPEEVLEKGQEYVTIPKKSKDIFKYYTIYVPELDGILIGRASINTRAVREVDVSNYEIVTNGKFSEQEVNNYLKNTNVIRNWERAGEIFITSDKKCIYKDYSWKFIDGHYVWQEDSDYVEHDKLSGNTPFKVQNIHTHNCGVNGEDWDELCKPFLNFFPQYCNFGVNNYGDILEMSENLKLFLNYKEPKKTKSKTQQKVDELVAIPIPEVSYYERYWKNVAFIQKVKPGMCVIRTMTTDYDAEKMIDCARIYVTKDKVIACRPQNNGGWISMSLKNGLHYWDMPLEYANEKDMEGTKLEYLCELFKKFDKDHRAKCICTLLAYPVIEQLAKAGFEELVLSEIGATFWEKGIKPFEKIFGKMEQKHGLIKNLGVNKYQFKRVASYINEQDYSKGSKGDTRHNYYYDFTPLKYLKEIFGNDISFYDNDTFDLFFDMLMKLDGLIQKNFTSYWVSGSARSIIDTEKRIFRLYGLNTLKKIAPKCLKIFEEDMEIRESSNNFSWRDSGINQYHDYISIVEQLNDPVHFGADFDSRESIENMHNIAMEVFNSKIMEINEKKFEKVVKKCDKWTFSDDNFTVVAPKIAEDIAVEGITLHHCVKGYIGKVTEDKTNILFIRKTDEIDKPFFTVEITNDAVVQQIHGFSNRNADTEEGLLDFVKKWVEAKDLKMSNFNKVR